MISREKLGFMTPPLSIIVTDMLIHATPVVWRFVVSCGMLARIAGAMRMIVEARTGLIWGEGERDVAI